MAIVTPPLSSIHAGSAGQSAEFEVLQALARGLPDSFSLFHSVDWAQVNPSGDSHGELDIVVVNRAGDLAILEVKAGELDFRPSGIFKSYKSKQRNVLNQVHWQFTGIQQRLREAGLTVRLLHLLVLPQHRVDGQSTVSFPHQRIVDASQCADLPGLILRTLGSGQADPAQARVCAFLDDRLLLKTDVSTLSGQLQHRVSQIAGGLAEWVPRIEAPSGIIRICGTAGSGKTQLALCLLRQAVLRQQRAAYVCYNRPLADHLRSIVPVSVEVATFHQLCWQAAGAASGAPDFAELVAVYLALLKQQPAALDLLIIDEMQDFMPDWVSGLTGRVKADGRIVLLDDPAQCLYPDRDEIDIAEAVLVHSQENFRSPRSVVDTINAFALTRTPVQGKSPFVGDLPVFETYQPEGGSLLRVTRKAIEHCLTLGYALADICLLSWRGLDRSELLRLDDLGPWSTRRFTGTYDVYGRPVWTEGRLLMETIRRIKGQAAAAVVITEIDFESFGTLERNMLFVGMTRARMHLELVLTERAAALLGAALAGGV